MTNNILEPLQLAAGSHQPGSGKGCAMNVISWENGDTTITDFPSCSDPLLARMVQIVNDVFANPMTGMLDSDASMKVLDLGHATVGTAYHSLNSEQLVNVYFQLEKVIRYESRQFAFMAQTATQREQLLYGTPFAYSVAYGYGWYEHLDSIKHHITTSFVNFVNLFSRFGNGGHIDASADREQIIKITGRLIREFKRLAHVEDVVTPIEKTQAAVEKMLVCV